MAKFTIKNENIANSEDYTKLLDILEKKYKLAEEIKTLEKTLYPTDAPNRTLRYAIVDGIRFNNNLTLKPRNFIKFFNFPYEETYIWTPERDSYSFLLVKVDEKVKELRVWRTLVKSLEIAISFNSELETLPNFEYKWIYRFNKTKKLGEHRFLNNSAEMLNWQSIHNMCDIAALAQILELLIRDELFFVASDMIVSAMKIHNFCQICALSHPVNQIHEHKEPEIWEYASMIQKLEIAIVQSTRVVECILGKPGKRQDKPKYEKFKKNWLEKIRLKPDSIFKQADISHIDFYYLLFEIRNSSAHSFGSLPFNLQRKIAIQAQSFAWIILGEYFEKNSLENKLAVDALNFNTELISKEPKNFSTIQTWNFKERNRLKKILKY